MEDGLSRKYRNFVRDFNIHSTWNDTYDESYFKLSNAEKDKIIKKNIQGAYTPRAIVLDFFSKYQNFKKNYEKLPRISAATTEAFNSYTESDTKDFQCLVIWLENINEFIAPSYLPACSHRSGNLMLIYRDNKYSAVIDNGYSSTSSLSRRINFDIDEAVIKEYLNFCHEHKVFIDTYNKLKRYKCNLKNPATFHITIIGNLFTGISKCHVAFGLDNKKCEYFVKATYTFDKEPKVKFLINPKTKYANEDETIFIIEKLIKDEDDVKKLVSDAMKNVYIKEELFYEKWGL